jgi:hypothetical protein
MAGTCHGIVVMENAVLREQVELPDVVIRADEIASLSEVPETGLTVEGDAEGELIEIPEGLEDYERCRELLGRWREIERPAPGFQPSALTRFVIGGGLLGSMFGFFSSSSPALVGPLGAVLLAAAAYSVRRLQKRRATAPGARVWLWPMGLFVLFVVLRVARVLGWLGP